MGDFFRWITEGGGGGDLAAAAAAIASAAAVIIVAFRKRRDVDITEMLKRLAYLESEVKKLKKELIRAEYDRFVLRRVLASNGIDDPTVKEADSA